MSATPPAPLEIYLPGLAPPDAVADAQQQQPGAPSSGWWVKRSARQTVDPADQPAGFRHQLMHGRAVVRTGVGADHARTFREQADFLNLNDERTQ